MGGRSVQSMSAGYASRPEGVNSSTRGRRIRKSKVQTPGAAGSQKSKPYDKSEKDREFKSFNDTVWEMAKRWFVMKLWSEFLFFHNANEKDITVDRCAIEAYEVAIVEYRRDFPARDGIIAKYRLQPLDSLTEGQCRSVVSGSGTYYNFSRSSLTKLNYSYFRPLFHIWKSLYKKRVSQ